MVKMLSKYDPVLKEHLMRLKQTAVTVKVSVSYLSPETPNEFINVLVNHVKEILINDARCFGIMLDSTPDILHADQVSEAIRFVKIYNGEVEVREVFLEFFPLKEKKLMTSVDIMICRAQGYDNAATMSETHGGVQAILKRKNKKAIFNRCVDQLFNLCGQHSFAENVNKKTCNIFQNS